MPELSASSSEPAERSIAGVGIGLRAQHINEVLERRPDIAWFEVLTDNHMASGGLIPKQLEAIRMCYPITLHGVGMSLGSVDPLDKRYLRQLKHMVERFEPAWVSDHLCFTRCHGVHFHDLVPLPYTETTVRHVAQRICQVQDFIGQRILIENVSSYLVYSGIEMTEGEFLAAVANRADCDILLDVNNVYVNDINHRTPVGEIFQALPPERVREIHLAGYEDKGDYLLDAHNHPVAAPVWKLYAKAQSMFPGTPALIEWDNDIPALDRLIQEADRADVIMQQTAARKSDYCIEVA